MLAMGRRLGRSGGGEVRRLKRVQGPGKDVRCRDESRHPHGPMERRAVSVSRDGRRLGIRCAQPSSRFSSSSSSLPKRSMAAWIGSGVVMSTPARRSRLIE